MGVAIITMHIWIDIDKKEDILLFSLLINELKETGHTIVVTASKFINTNDINTKKIGYVFSFFGLVLEPLYFIRAVLLADYIKDRKIDIALSLGSRSMLYTCIQADVNLPIIHFLADYEKRPHNLYFAFDKCFFIVSENIQDQKLIEKGYDPNKIARYKGIIKTDNPDPKVIKEIANQIEFFSNKLPGSVTA